MEHTPIFLTELVLARILKELVMHIGVGDTYADILTQTHMQISPIYRTWSSFLAKNCLKCQHSPESCKFLSPTEKDCTENTTPASIRDANSYLIEKEHTKICPLIEEMK